LGRDDDFFLVKRWGVEGVFHGNSVADWKKLV
jgi:hypothetical protein